MSIKQATLEVLAEARRGAIVRVMAETGNFGLSLGSLQDALDRLGRPAGIDEIRADVEWLERMRLVTTETDGPITVGTLTAHGEDVAKGRVRVAGVQRPER